MSIKFKFLLNESRIYDFLIFPSMIHASRHIENEGNENYIELILDEYKDFAKKIEERLEPYRKEIEVFYMYKLEFIDLIFKLNRFLNYENEEEYLNTLLDLSGIEINKSIVYSLMREYESYPPSDELVKNAEEISLDRDELVAFIKDLPIESGDKWNLFCIIDEPIKYMKKYVDLMRKLMPIFEDLYKDYRQKIKDYGENLEKFLNMKGTKGLEEMTYSMVNSKMLGDKDALILISAMFVYQISLFTGETPYMVWGLKIQEVFEKIKEVNENKTNERVLIFKNLGDKTRYEVLKLIASNKTSVKEIAETLGVSSATISYHINNLVTSKIIKLDKTDDKIKYHVDYKLLEESMEGLKEDLRFSTNVE